MTIKRFGGGRVTTVITSQSRIESISSDLLYMTVLDSLNAPLLDSDLYTLSALLFHHLYVHFTQLDTNQKNSTY